jgi:hypothetical protein
LTGSPDAAMHAREPDQVWRAVKEQPALLFLCKIYMSHWKPHTMFERRKYHNDVPEKLTNFRENQSGGTYEYSSFFFPTLV